MIYPSLYQPRPGNANLVFPSCIIGKLKFSLPAVSGGCASAENLIALIPRNFIKQLAKAAIFDYDGNATVTHTDDLAAKELGSYV
jgi:hypothetical protein